jgi:hypothetical protein
MWETKSKSLAAVVFAIALAVYLVNPDPFWTGDMNSSTILAFNLLEFHTLDLSHFRDSELLRPFGGYSFSISPVHGGVTLTYPVGTAFVTFPLYALFYAWLKLFGPGISLTAAAFEPYRLGLSHIAAAILSAVTLTTFFLIVRPRFGLRAALVTTACLAFATMQWGILSQSLFQQTPSAFVIMAASWALLQAERAPLKSAAALLCAAGALSGLLYLIRPTNLIFMLALLTFALVWFRSLAFSAGFLVTGALSVGWNWYDWHTLTGAAAFFQQHTYHFTPATFVAGFIGLTFSPDAGAFPNSPVLLLAFPGAFAVVAAFLRRRISEPADLLFLMLLGASGVLLASYAFSPFWDGGGYGPRYISETMPIVMYFVNFLRVLRPAEPIREHRLAVGGLALTAALGFFAQFTAIVGGHTGLSQWLNAPIGTLDAPEDQRYEYMFVDPLRSFATRRWAIRDSFIERIWRGVYAKRFLMSPTIVAETNYGALCKGTILDLRDKRGRSVNEFRLASVYVNRPYADRLRELFSQGRKFVYARVRNDGKVPLFGYKSGLSWGYAAIATTVINDQGGIISQGGSIFVADNIQPGQTGEAFGNMEIATQKGRYRIEAQVSIGGLGACGSKIELGTLTVE